jgi:hypothetical protein
VTDHDVVDDPLHAGDDVLEHGRPGKPPDRGNEGTFDEGAIELLCGFLQGCVLSHILKSWSREDAKTRS